MWLAAQRVKRLSAGSMVPLSPLGERRLPQSYAKASLNHPVHGQNFGAIGCACSLNNLSRPLPRPVERLGTLIVGMAAIGADAPLLGAHNLVQNKRSATAINASTH